MTFLGRSFFMAAMLVVTAFADVAMAGPMDEFLDGKKQPTKSSPANPAAPAAAGAAASEKPVIASKQQLAKEYKKLREKYDCVGIWDLADWEGVDFWTKESFSDSLCAKMYKGIVDISIQPVDAATLSDQQGRDGGLRVYTITPEAKMIVKFEKPNLGKGVSTPNPMTEYMIAKNKNGSYVFVTTKRKSN